MKELSKINYLFIFFLACAGFWVGCEQRDESLYGEAKKHEQPPVESHPVLSPLTDSPTIVAFGDSLTAGLGVNPRKNYPALLEEKLKKEGYSYRVINAGVSGDTTAGGLRRVDWVLKNKPEIVILELGANDGLRGQSLTLTYQNLAGMIVRFQEGGATVILAGMKLPRNYGEEYGKAFEKVFYDLSEEFDLPFIPFFLEGVALRPEFNQGDGIHPTEEGYEKVVETLWPVLKPVLKKG